MERMVIGVFGAKKIATTLGVPLSTTKRWLQRLRSDGDMASHNIGRPRGAKAGLCVMSFCMFRLTSLGVSRVPFVCGSMAVMRSAFLPQRSSTPGFLLSHVAQSLGARKRLQASGIERGRSSVQRLMTAEHWPAKQVICG